VKKDMGEEKGYEFLEHTADAYIAAYGKDLTEAFENAALAMFDVMTDVEKVIPEIKEGVDVREEDLHALLYSWLEALLIKADTQGILYSRFEVLTLREAEGHWNLLANIWGEKFDPQKHPQKVGVKAVTYHRMEIIRDPGKVTLKFILDI
jgi:SHS2 domain-containing protein